jgi:hypothetical protein
MYVKCNARRHYLFFVLLPWSFWFGFGCLVGMLRSMVLCTCWDAGPDVFDVGFVVWLQWDI